MRSFFQEKITRAKVSVTYTPETRKKLPNGVILCNPGNLFVSCVGTCHKKKTFQTSCWKTNLVWKSWSSLGIWDFFSKCCQNFWTDKNDGTLVYKILRGNTQKNPKKTSWGDWYKTRKKWLILMSPFMLKAHLVLYYTNNKKSIATLFL